MISQYKIQYVLLLTIFIFALNNLYAKDPIIINHLNWDPANLESGILSEIRKQYIMFGHQSVGLNIIEGLETLAYNNPERYSLKILNNPSALTQPALVRWINGENFKPHGKIDAFMAKMKSEDANSMVWAKVGNIAYFKFCYVDFNSLDIDINAIFDHYIASMESLITAYPNCMLVHITIPITALIWASDKQRNVNRHLYNEKLRAYIDSTGGFLYDLADLEAYDESENYQSFEYSGKTYPMMWYSANDPQNNGYSYDGGHLNAKGKLHMASAMWSLWGAMIKTLVPVELIQFKANIINEGVELIWTTASESNNYGFEIERSIDNKYFERIGFVNGNGTLSMPKLYRFIDKNPPANTVFYRLVQIDYNGHTEILTTIEIKLADSEYKFYKLFQNYPNPFNNITIIEFQLPCSQYVNMVVYDIYGREIMKLIQNEKLIGYNSIFLKADRLSNGIYFYKIAAGDYLDIKKMTVIK